MELAEASAYLEGLINVERMPDLRVARLTDVALIERARAEATRLLEEDPELRRPEHAALRTRVEELWGRISAEAS